MDVVRIEYFGRALYVSVAQPESNILMAQDPRIARGNSNRLANPVYLQCLSWARGAQCNRLELEDGTETPYECRINTNAPIPKIRLCCGASILYTAMVRLVRKLLASKSYFVFLN